MKRGTEYAKRIKQLHHQMLKKFGKPNLPEPTDPIQQLIIGILAENSSEHKAAALFKRICDQMVDLNELRVTPPLELAETIGSAVSQAGYKAERIIRVLNEIRARQDALDLSFLKQRGRREAREYLDSLEGAGPFASASVITHSLNGHAIPVDYLTLYVLRKDEAVDNSADVATVQSFLERNVSAAESRAFAILLNRHVAAEGARVQANRLPDLLNLAPPPPIKPWRKPGMDKPGLPLPKDMMTGMSDLDGASIEDAMFAEEGLDVGNDGEEKPAAKHPATKQSAPKQSAPKQPAAKTGKAQKSEPASKPAKHAGGGKAKSTAKAKPKPASKKKK